MTSALLHNVNPELLDKSKWTDRIIVDGEPSDDLVPVPLEIIFDMTFPNAAFKLYSFYSGLAMRGATCAPPIEEQCRIVGYSRKKLIAARKEIMDRGLYPFDEDASAAKAGELA